MAKADASAGARSRLRHVARGVEAGLDQDAAPVEASCGAAIPARPRERAAGRRTADEDEVDGEELTGVAQAE